MSWPRVGLEGPHRVLSRMLDSMMVASSVSLAAIPVPHREFARVIIRASFVVALSVVETIALAGIVCVVLAFVALALALAPLAFALWFLVPSGFSRGGLQ